VAQTVASCNSSSAFVRDSYSFVGGLEDSDTSTNHHLIRRGFPRTGSLTVEDLFSRNRIDGDPRHTDRFFIFLIVMNALSLIPVRKPAASSDVMSLSLGLP